MHQSSIYSFLIIFLLIFLLHYSKSSVVTAQEVEDEKEFDYSESGEKGPAHWGDLKQEWGACKSGGMQSPIDMSSDRVQVVAKSPDIQRTYYPCNAILKNRGHDISLQWLNNSAGMIKINGSADNYILQQGHWHSPSEHTINGRRFDLELHMVHVCPDPNVTNYIAVIALLYKIGPPDPFLSKLMENVMPIADQMAERNIGEIDPKDIKMGGRKYYRYMGSLTVPPCTEGVIWTINKKIRTVSQDQVNALRTAVHDFAEVNARPLQPLNSRRVQLYDPGPENTPN
ncbi:hypothetical protein Ddye_007961 [Dipteronia dyeriana]|uniref:Carbonic anhydrase n=1 Tax=Dipteronia dyeriana TaxID=168575 RepID=A0AAE0CKX3_9ROSI|nr:hypothetical protein Ddye_007961 [Dipteronia dyeriana]